MKPGQIYEYANNPDISGVSYLVLIAKINNGWEVLHWWPDPRDPVDAWRVSEQELEQDWKLIIEL